MWTGHAWRKQEFIVKQGIEENPVRKRLFGGPKLRWEDRDGCQDL